MLFENEDDEVKNIEEDSETDFIVNPMDKEKYILPYSLYFRLSTYDIHYSEASLKYKRLAITWLIASLIGVGSLATENLDNPFFRFFSISLLCLVAVKGIAVLWFMDVGIYQKFIRATTKVTIPMEKRFKFLPPLCLDEEILTAGQKDHVFYTSLFYGYCLLGILVVPSIGVYNNLSPRFGKANAAILAVLSFSLSVFVVFKIIYRVAKKT